jgi:hypothetical protein
MPSIEDKRGNSCYVGNLTCEENRARAVQRYTLVSAIVLTLNVAACTSTLQGSLSHYWGVPSVKVATRCGGGYQVFRYKDEPRFLVSAYAISNVYKSVCERNGSATQSVTGVNHEEAANAYIAETSRLNGCRITRGTSITPLHSEFTLDCPAAPAPRPKTNRP